MPPKSGEDLVTIRVRKDYLHGLGRTWIGLPAPHQALFASSGERPIWYAAYPRWYLDGPVYDVLVPKSYLDGLIEISKNLEEY